MEHKEHPLKPRLPLVKSDDYAFLVNIYSTKNSFIEEKRPAEFTERQDKIIQHLKKNNRVNTSSCATLLGVSTDTALRELNMLKKKGIIVRMGVGRTIYYVLK